MMFVGAIPRETCAQIAEVADLSTVTDAFICCSGSFRVEQALAVVRPEIRSHSNDVSLLSTAIGWYATGQPLDFRFVKDLSFIEDAVHAAGASPLDRLAGVAIALRMCHLRGHNDFIDAQIRDHRERVGIYLERAREKLAKYVSSLHVADYFPGDFREHAARATGPGDMVFAWPPVIRGDYERFYRLIHNNVEWTPPSYNVFDPKTLPSWMNQLDAGAVRYVVCCYTDLTDTGHLPVAIYTKGRSKAVYTYSNCTQRSSLRRSMSKSVPFRYQLPDASRFTLDSEVKVVPVTSDVMNHIKDVFQLPGLVHTDGEFRFLVFVDGMLVGGFVYATMSAKAHYNDPRMSRGRSIYLLSDFATTRDGRVSKLVAMLASGQDQVISFDRRRFQRTQVLVTTAFSNNPVSMKYRGIYDLYSRRESDGAWKYQLNYIKEVSRVSNAEIYRAWFNRWHRTAGQGGQRE